MPDRRAEVLARIEAVRARRAEMLGDVLGDRVDFAGIFATAGSDPAVATMKLLPLVESLDGVGKVQSRRALESVGLPETVLVEDVGAGIRPELERRLFGPRL